MTPSFREIADRCDAFDEDVKAITDARKDFWGEVRDQLPARDVRALKAAIKARKRRRADMEGEEDHDQRTYEILAEIEAGTIPALAHARRANDPPHDSDGVIIEEPEAQESATVGEGRPVIVAGFSDDASPPIPQPAAGLPSAAAPVELSPLPDIAPGAPFPEMPSFLDRRPVAA